MATNTDQKAAPRRAFYLVVRGEEKDGEQFEIGPNGLLVGRSSTCDVIFQSREISRRHAYFYSEGENCWVEDLGAKNGVIVNGRQVKKQLLSSGDTVDLGPIRLLFRVRGRKDSSGGWPAALRWAATPFGGAPAGAHQGLGAEPLAAASTAFAALSYLHWAFGVSGVVLATLAMVEMRGQPSKTGRTAAVAGLALGLTGALMNAWFVELAPRIRARQEAAAQEQCARNLTNVWKALRAHLNARGAYPDRLAELADEGLLDKDDLTCAGSILQGSRAEYLYALRARGMPAHPFEVVACDPDMAAHQHSGGWVLRANGQVQWLSAGQFARLLEQLGHNEVRPAQAGQGR